MILKLPLLLGSLYLPQVVRTGIRGRIRLSMDEVRHNNYQRDEKQCDESSHQLSQFLRLFKRGEHLLAVGLEFQLFGEGIQVFFDGGARPDQGLGQFGFYFGIQIEGVDGFPEVNGLELPFGRRYNIFAQDLFAISVLSVTSC